MAHHPALWHNTVMENWKDVISYEGFYQVSDAGRVRALTGYRAGLLKPEIDYHGYPRVTLWHQGTPERFLVHRLVMIMFVGVAPEGKEVNHRNGKRDDARLENLEYVTKSENNKHAYDVLGKKSQKGSTHGRSKLTEEQVKQIRKWATLESQDTLAKHFGVNVSTISMIINRKTWKHV
jgi:hypothetical protein